MPLTPSFGDDLAGPIVALYARAESRLIHWLATSLDAERGFGPTWFQRTMLRIPKFRRGVALIMRDVEAQAPQQITEAIMQGWANGERAALADMPDGSRWVPVSDGSSALFARQTVQAIVATHPQAHRVSENVYRQIVTDVTRDQRATSEAARKRLVQKALNQFAAKGITGFVDGRGRRFDLVSYVETAIRTSVSNAEIEAYTRTAAESGQDLLIVSDVRQSCELCFPFEGKLISITGATVGAISAGDDGARRVNVLCSLREARERGLFHRGCRHMVKIWTPEDPLPPVDSPPDPEGYKATQKLRGLERKVRQQKNVLAAAQSPEAELEAKRAIMRTQAAIRAHVDDTGVKRQRQREQPHRGYDTTPPEAAAGGGGDEPPNGPPQPPSAWDDGDNPPFEHERHKALLKWANRDGAHRVAHEALGKIMRRRFDEELPIEELDAAVAALERERQRLGITRLIDQHFSAFDADELAVAILYALKGNHNITSLVPVPRKPTADMSVGVDRVEVKTPERDTSDRSLKNRLKQGAVQADRVVVNMSKANRSFSDVRYWARNALRQFPNLLYIRVYNPTTGQDEYEWR